jgi:hypothetical protein
MDKEVLIRFIEMIESVLSRVNSKRLMTLYAFYWFLYAMRDTLTVPWVGAMSAWSTAFVLWTFYKERRDALTETPKS